MASRICCGQFLLEKTLRSGQFFTWFQDGDWFVIVHRDEIWRVRQEGQTLVCVRGDVERLSYFLGLDGWQQTRWRQLREDLPQPIFEAGQGITILRQDLWQCLVTFLCSAAAPMTKITQNLWSLSYRFGESYEIGGHMIPGFPKPGVLDDESALREAKTGYRATYLLTLNHHVKEHPQWLDEVSSLSYAEARTQLMQLPGVGPKIADCVCLFGLGHEEAFPVDTWIQQYVQRYLSEDGRKPSPEACAAILMEEYPRNRGLIQQYIFHYMTQVIQKVP